MTWGSEETAGYRAMIEGTGERTEGEHWVTDEVRDGPHPGFGEWDAALHAVVVCQLCGAEVPECCGADLPEECVA